MTDRRRSATASLDVFRRMEREQAQKRAKESYCEEMGIDPDATPRRTVELSCHAR